VPAGLDLDSMRKFVSAVIGLGLGVFCWCAAGQDTTPAKDKTAPRELIQYVSDAKKAGMNEVQIEQAATKAGWPATDVELALTSVRTEPKAAKDADAASKADGSGGAERNAKTDGDAKPPGGVATFAGDHPATPAEMATPAAAPGKTDSAPVVTPGPGAVGAPLTGGAPGTVAPAGLPAKPDDAAPNAKPPVINRRVSDDYKIGEGDILQISVWGEPTASVSSVVVRPDGKISLPLLKDVAVEGLTPLQLEKIITDQFIASNQLKAPDVTIMVTQINSKKIYMNGAVKKEGPIPYNYRMTVLQALSEAGGLTDYAKRKRIYILHNDNGRQFKYLFDYDAVLKGQHMEQNIELEAGDTIVVPH
jgi:polysaccharide export outer membrane protein